MMWGRKSKISLAKPASYKAGVQAYVGRKLKKRNNRGLWQIKINAAARELGTTYSLVINKLKKQNISLDRKILSQIAEKYPAVFAKIVK